MKQKKILWIFMKVIAVLILFGTIVNAYQGDPYTTVQKGGFFTDINNIVVSDSIVNKVPVARKHVKLIDINGAMTPILYSSKLRKIIQLNYSHGNNHREGKAVVDAYWDVLAGDRYYGENSVPAFTVTRKTSTRGKPQGDGPAVSGDVTENDINAHDLIISNNISATSALPGTILQAVRNAIVQRGLGYLAFHGSGDDNRRSWNFYEDTLHPTVYGGHGTRASAAPVYASSNATGHIVLQDVFTDYNLPGIVRQRVYDLDTARNTSKRITVPVRLVPQEWYRYGRNLETYSFPAGNRFQVLLKYDPSSLPAGALGNANKFKASNNQLIGNPFVWVIYTGKGRASYLAPGHTYLVENGIPSDMRAMMTGKNNNQPTNDYMRLLGQLIFYLAGYDRSLCSDDNSCLNRTIVDDNDRIVMGENEIPKSCQNASCTATSPVSVLTTPITSSQIAVFSSFSLGVEISQGQNYQIKVYNSAGQVLDQVSGLSSSKINYKPSNSLSNGVYFLSVSLNSQDPQVKRYVVVK